MMDPSLKADLVRRGNAAMNSGDYAAARDFYTRAGYKAGLIRLGDFYMYERRLPLLAYGYYKRAGATDKIEDLHRRMIGAMGEWLGHDKLKDDSLKMLFPETPAPSESAPDQDGMIHVPVNPLLREEALKILNRGR